MSLVESCKASGLDPAVYLNDVLQERRHRPDAPPASLTPWAWKEQRGQAAAREARRREANAQLAAAALEAARRN